MLELDFRLGGNSRFYCGPGWMSPEEGYRWSLGPLSELCFRDLPQKAAYALVVTASPFAGPQRIVFVANDKHICEVVVNGSETFGCVIPGEVASAGAELRIGLQQPDARRVRDVFQVPDDRSLGIAVVRMTITAVDRPATSDSTAHVPLRDLMLRFENLGDNCEFGIVQRRCGADPLGLFRFSSAPLNELIAGLGDGFTGLTDHENLLLLNPDEGPAEVPREHLLFQRKYNLIYHTLVFENQMKAEALFAREQREQRKLAFLHAKFMEDLADGTKIFVVKRNSHLTEGEVVPLWQALRSYGPNTLLWVVPADPAHPGGTVEVRHDGLLKGYLDRFAPYEDATDVSIECWIALCRNAIEARGRMASSDAVAVGHGVQRLSPPQYSAAVQPGA